VSTFLPVHTVNSVQTLKADGSTHAEAGAGGRDDGNTLNQVAVDDEYVELDWDSEVWCSECSLFVCLHDAALVKASVRV
jgi:hypothetical protein